MGGVVGGMEGRTEGQRGWILPQLNGYTMMGSPCPIELSLMALYSSVVSTYLRVRDYDQNLKPNDIYVIYLNRGDRGLLEKREAVTLITPPVTSHSHPGKHCVFLVHANIHVNTCTICGHGSIIGSL